MKGFHAGVHTLIDEPTYVEEMGSFIAKHVRKFSINERHSVKFDVKRIKDEHYFVKRAYQLLKSKDNPVDADSFQWRTNLVRCLEHILKTEFRNTRDFKEKCRNFLAKTKSKSVVRSPGKRIMRARNKLKWNQEKLMEELGIRSRTTIHRYEKDLVYPSAKVMKWLNKVEKQ